jgi:hypothetical protein
MQLILRLGSLLGQGEEIPRGTIQEIAQETRLERHKVASLVRGEAKYISLDTLGRMCEAIAQRHSLSARELAAELFDFLPDDFWRMLGDCDRLQFCLGKRHVPNWPGKDYVMASDSYLQGVILSQISDQALRRDAKVPAHHFPPPHLLLSEAEQLGKEAKLSQKLIDEALSLSASCRRQHGNALIAIGSVKVNALVEVLCAEWFKAEPFVSQDELESAEKRNVPVFFCFREDDMQPRSCCGGTRLAKRRRRDCAGIHFEGNDGKWTECVCDDESRDAAFLFYTYRPLSKQVEIACGGFSGEATRVLASRLTQIVSGVKAQYVSPNLHMGMYAVEINFKRSKREREQSNGKEEEFDFMLHPVGAEALQRRLGPPQSPRAKVHSPAIAAAEAGTKHRRRKSRPR